MGLSQTTQQDAACCLPSGIRTIGAQIRLPCCYGLLCLAFSTPLIADARRFPVHIHLIIQHRNNEHAQLSCLTTIFLRLQRPRLVHLRPPSLTRSCRPKLALDAHPRATYGTFATSVAKILPVSLSRTTMTDPFSMMPARSKAETNTSRTSCMTVCSQELVQWSSRIDLNDRVQQKRLAVSNPITTTTKVRMSSLDVTSPPNSPVDRPDLRFDLNATNNTPLMPTIERHHRPTAIHLAFMVAGPSRRSETHRRPGTTPRPHQTPVVGQSDVARRFLLSDDSIGSIRLFLEDPGIPVTQESIRAVVRAALIRRQRLQEQQREEDDDEADDRG